MCPKLTPFVNIPPFVYFPWLMKEKFTEWIYRRVKIIAFHLEFAWVLLLHITKVLSVDNAWYLASLNLGHCHWIFPEWLWMFEGCPQNFIEEPFTQHSWADIKRKSWFLYCLNFVLFMDICSILIGLALNLFCCCPSEHKSVNRDFPCLFGTIW